MADAPLPLTGVSRYTRTDPETGWEETYEREHGEGGWMLVSTTNASMKKDDAPLRENMAAEMRRTAKELRKEGFDEEVCRGNERIAEYIESLEQKLSKARELLREVEWSGEAPYGNVIHSGWCWFCSGAGPGMVNNKHKSECPLGDFLTDDD